MENSIFKFNLPEDFNLTVDKQTQVRFANTKIDFDNQPPYFDFNLFHIKNIEDLKGNTFLDKYIAWSEGFQTEVISAEKTSFKNYCAYRVTTKSDAVFQGKQYKISYVNVCILLDDMWCVEYQFVYETKNESTFKDVAESTLQSLEILGTENEWLQAHLADVKQVDEAHKARLRALAVEDKPKLDIAPFKIPKDEKEYITIGDFKFDFVKEECQWNTVESSQKLYVQIKAKTTAICQAKDKGLLEYGYELDDGEIKLSFDCSEIYNNGIPTGAFNFEESKTGAPHFIHFRKSGIPLDFYGNITLQDGWLGINGVLKKSYQDEPNFKITVYKKMPTNNLDWSVYQFNLEEALQIEPKIVRHLWVKNNNEIHFPKEILTFKNLKTLRIQAHSGYFGNAKSIPLNEVPDAIENLTELQELSIINTSVNQLPESLGKLKKLEILHLYNNNLKSLPESVFLLPNLIYLWANKNEINSIPTNINLPELKKVDLQNSQLITLPESLAMQPKLETIKLNGNPLETLPEAFNNINVELDINDKRRLLHYDYQGADGKGTIVWNNEIYSAKNDANLQQKLSAAVSGTVLEKYKDALEKLALKAVGVNTTEADDYSLLGNTRFGGLPDLPLETEYPNYFNDYDKETVHFIFIAQLNCEELATYQDYLPRKGMLYFYLEDEERFVPKVIYYPDSKNLESAKNIDVSKLNIFDLDEPYNPFKVEISSFVALPSFYNDDYWYKLIDSPELENLEDYDHEDHIAFSEDLQDKFSKNLGKKGVYQEWNNCYYPDRHHSINDYVFTQHESPQEQAALAHKGNPEDWVVLLKVDSDNNCGFCFWDAGELFFVIHKSDLAKGDFSKVYSSIESS